MSGVAKIIVLGRLGRDPELRQTHSGKSVCNFSLAVSETYTDASGAKQETVEWIPVVAFGITADNCAKYLKKGHQCYVEGKWKSSKWVDKNRAERTSIACNAQQVVFLGGKSDSRQDAQDGPQGPRTEHPGVTRGPAAPAGRAQRSEFTREHLPELEGEEVQF
jgi:single-strand DNA-binding protein